MAYLLTAIRVLGAAFTTVQFGLDHFAPSTASSSVVRIQVGLDYQNGLNNAGGDAPRIQLYNEAGVALGKVEKPGSIEKGAFKDTTVKQTAAQQATYGLFTAHDDAICISYISITWPDDQKHAWIGDLGKACGADWYWSNTYIDNNYQPACMWIDGNGDATRQTSFQVHFPEIGGTELPPEGSLPGGKDYYCSGPPFNMYKNHDPTITWWILGPHDHRRTERYVASSHNNTILTPPTNRTSNNNLDSNRLVLNDSPLHSTYELCNSKTSVGPDFVNVQEGFFCCMTSRVTYPICKDGVTDNCFDMNSKTKITGGKVSRTTPYTSVIDWTTNNLGNL